MRKRHHGEGLGVSTVAGRRVLGAIIVNDAISSLVGWLMTMTYHGSLELCQERDKVNSHKKSHFKNLPWNSLFLTIYTFLGIYMLATTMTLIRMCRRVKSRVEWENTPEMRQKEQMLTFPLSSHWTCQYKNTHSQKYFVCSFVFVQKSSEFPVTWIKIWQSVS